MAKTALPAAASGPGAGHARWWFGQLALIKAGAADTDGRYTLVEIVVPANYATPLHAHGREDEAFWILDGEAVFDVGGQTFDASARSYLLAPRGVAHRFTAGASGARIMYGPGPLGQTLLEHQLLDELQFALHPILVGRGRQLFREGEKTSLELIATETLATGVVVLTYRPAGPNAGKAIS